MSSIAEELPQHAGAWTLKTPDEGDGTPGATVRPTEAASQSCYPDFNSCGRSRSSQRKGSYRPIISLNSTQTRLTSFPPPRPPQLNLCPATFSTIHLKDGGREEEEEEQGD